MRIRNRELKAKAKRPSSIIDNKGALLLEIAIALCVIGIISSFFISKNLITNRALKTQVVKNNIEYVTIALSAYLANYSRLPRPAHDKSGVEDFSSYQGLSAFVGTVPFSTLGIPEKYTLDDKLKPLIYIVEPELTGNFNRIYEQQETDGSEFCKGIVTPSIIVKGINNQPPDVIAFVIDTKKPEISDKIFVSPSYSTNWVSRDIILMRYLKNTPCKQEKHVQEDIITNDDFAF